MRRPLAQPRHPNREFGPRGEGDEVEVDETTGLMLSSATRGLVLIHSFTFAPQLSTEIELTPASRAAPRVADSHHPGTGFAAVSGGVTVLDIGARGPSST